MISRTATTASPNAVNAAIARALVDNDFLAALIRDRDQALLDMGFPQQVRMDLARLDLATLELLSGFVCKVQNNDLWRTFPLTLRMIQTAGYELEIFGAYRSHRPARGVSLRYRAEAFVKFLGAYVTDCSAAVPGLGDLVRHEWLLGQMANGWCELPPRCVEPRSGQAPTRETGEWQPQLRGLVVIRHYASDPLSAQRGAEATGLNSVNGPPDSDVFLCYSKDPASDAPVRVFRMDPAVATIVGSIDGKRRPKDIAELVGWSCEVETVIGVLAAAIDKGLVMPATTRPGIVPTGCELHRDPILQALNGHAVSRILYTLQRAGVLDCLDEPRQISDVAAAVGVDRSWLEFVLEFVASNGPIVRRLADGRYFVDLDAQTRQRLAFELTKFVGAYGSCLDVAGPAPESADQAALAAGFARSSELRRRRGSVSVPASILQDLDVTSALLDLGCGTADLLIEFATLGGGCHGIGIDANTAMCAAARNHAERAGVTSLVQIYHGDAVNVLTQLPMSVRERIGAVHAGSFFNALFRTSTNRAVGALTVLRQLLSDRFLLVNDYYGQLGSGAAGENGTSWSLLQDAAQVCSGQGVPPGSREDWDRLYQQAGCRLLRVYESESDGYRRFIHVVHLGGQRNNELATPGRGYYGWRIDPN